MKTETTTKDPACPVPVRADATGVVAHPTATAVDVRSPRLGFGQFHVPADVRVKGWDLR